MTREEFARGQRAAEGPAWRYRTAAKLAMQTGPAVSTLHDRALSDAVKYRRLLGQDGKGVARATAAYPLIAAAERLNEDPEKTAPLKLMVLADLPPEEMHSRTGVEIAVLDVWEALFFDARKQQQANIWLAHHVVEKERSTGDPQFASKLKLALMAGPVAVRGLLDHHDGKCLDEADRLFQRRLILNAKFDAAVEMPIDSEKSRLAFIKLHIGLMEGEKRLALAERRLAQLCAEACDKHEMAKLRLAQAAELRTIDRSEQLRKSEQKAMRAALEQQQLQDLHEQQLKTMSRQRQEQASASPLAQLTWAVNESLSCKAVSPVPDVDETSASVDMCGDLLMPDDGDRRTESKDAHGVAA